MVKGRKHVEHQDGSKWKAKQKPLKMGAQKARLLRVMTVNAIYSQAFIHNFISKVLYTPGDFILLEIGL